MKIVVEELTGSNTCSQPITLLNPLMIDGIRLYLYSHGNPAGTFTFTIKSAAYTVFSKTFTSALMKTDLGTSNNYFHIWYSIPLDDLLSLNAGTYTFEVTDTSGYTFSDSNFMSWVKPFEDVLVNTDYTVADLTKKPFGLELWSYRI